MASGTTTKRGGPSLSSRARELYQTNPEWLQDTTLDRAVQALQTMAPRESNDKLRKAISKAKGQLQGKGGRTSRGNGAGNGATPRTQRWGITVTGEVPGKGGVMANRPWEGLTEGAMTIGRIDAGSFHEILAEIDKTLLIGARIAPEKTGPLKMLQAARREYAQAAEKELVGTGAR